MKRKTFLGLIPAGIGMLTMPLSCVEETVKKQKGTVTVRPLTDEKIKAEIHSMVQGKYQFPSGRTAIPPFPGLPPGYDYNNMQEVTISGTNWVTYVADSFDVNTEIRKKSVGLYYQSGQFKNWLYVDHAKTFPNGRERHIIRYHIPCQFPNNWVQGMVYMDDGSVATLEGLNATTGPCGQGAMDCITEFYTNKGWLSLGLFVASAFAWGVPVGVAGGCLIGVCFLGWHAQQTCP
jgi:hypothetical protein